MYSLCAQLCLLTRSVRVVSFPRHNGGSRLSAPCSSCCLSKSPQLTRHHPNLPTPPSPLTTTTLYPHRARLQGYEVLYSVTLMTACSWVWINSRKSSGGWLCNRACAHTGIVIVYRSVKVPLTAVWYHCTLMSSMNPGTKKLTQTSTMKSSSLLTLWKSCFPWSGNLGLKQYQVCNMLLS